MTNKILTIDEIANIIENHEDIQEFEDPSGVRRLAGYTAAGAGATALGYKLLKKPGFHPVHNALALGGALLGGGIAAYKTRQLLNKHAESELHEILQQISLEMIMNESKLSVNELESLMEFVDHANIQQLKNFLNLE